MIKNQWGWLLVGVVNKHVDIKLINVSWLFQEKKQTAVMDVSGLVQYNNNEGGKISSIVLQKLFVFFFFKMSTGQYFSPTTQLPSHKDTGIGAVATRKVNRGMKHVLEKQASQRALRSRNDIPTSLTPTQLRSADTQLSIGMPHACKN